MENENPICTLGDYSRPSHEGYRNTIELPDGNNVVPLRSDTICMDSFQGLTLKVPHYGIDLWLQVQIFYDHVNPATRRTIGQSAGDVPSTSDRRLITLENQVQRLMEAHLAPKSSVQMNKIASSCEIYSGPHDTQYCMENPEQAFVEYASSRTDKARGKWNSSSPKSVHFINTITILSKEDEPKEERITEPNKDKDNDHIAIIKMKEKVGEDESRDIKQEGPDDRAHGDTMDEEKVEEESEESEEEIKEETEKEEEDDPEYFDTFPTIEEFGNHEWILKNPRPPRVSAKIHNQRNFTYECDFVIVKDTTSVIDHYLGGMVLGKPFVKESGLILS
ncbi:hypothetical protein Tco_1405761 [Tanacetum coccineum]